MASCHIIPQLLGTVQWRQWRLTAALLELCTFYNPSMILLEKLRLETIPRWHVDVLLHKGHLQLAVAVSYTWLSLQSPRTFMSQGEPHWYETNHKKYYIIKTWTLNTRYNNKRCGGITLMNTNQREDCIKKIKCCPLPSGESTVICVKSFKLENKIPWLVDTKKLTVSRKYGITIPTSHTETLGHPTSPSSPISHPSLRYNTVPDKFNISPLSSCITRINTHFKSKLSLYVDRLFYFLKYCLTIKILAS